MTHARQLCLAVVALATSARAAGPSRAVLALREAPARCKITDEPKRFLVFTRQRSGSRWFVDTISALGDGHRFVEPHIRELSLNGTPFHGAVNRGPKFKGDLRTGRARSATISTGLTRSRR